MGQGEGVGFRCRSRPDRGLVQKSQCVEWGSLQPFYATRAATRLPGQPTGPRRPRLRQQACLVALVRAVADVRANDAWALVGARGCPARPPRWRGRLFSSGGSRRARTGLLQRWGSVLHEGPYWLSHQLLSAFAAMDREPGSRRPISAIEAPFALKFELRRGPARSNPRKKNTRFLRIFATREGSISHF